MGLLKNVFKEEMKKLCVIYNYTSNSDQMSEYYHHLKNTFTNDGFKATCEEIILKERFFPSIAVFIENKEVSIKIKSQSEIDKEDAEYGI